MKKNILRKIPAILSMAGLFMLSAMPGHDPFIKPPFDINDKMAHTIAYFILGLSFCISIPSQKWFSKPIVRGILVIAICTVFGISDEYHQSFVPGRSGNDLGDLAADIIGSFFAPIVYFAALKLRAILWHEPKP